MERRCVVETWTDLGFLGKACTPKVKFGAGTFVFICTGSDEVFVFSAHEKRLTAVLRFPGPVRDVAESHDEQLLFVASRSGVYCVSLQSLLHRVQSSSDDPSCGPAELDISSESLVAGADGVLTLLLVGSLLLTLCRTDTSWLLTLYKRTQSGACEVLGSFGLPLVSPALQSAGSKTGPARGPVLTCVHPAGDATPSSPAPSAAAGLCLQPLLFKLLFGVEAALAASPVVLCSLPDGRLCFLPLRVPGPQLRVLHSLEQPLVFVGASVVKETSAGHAQCLVAVGEEGRVVLIRGDGGGAEGGGSAAAFTEVHVPGPVLCGTADRNCLYYSTGADLCCLNLSDGLLGREEKSKGGEASGMMSNVAPLSPSSLNVCQVADLADPRCSDAGEVELLGLSSRGQLQRISLPVRREDEGCSRHPSSQIGRSVKDLLSAIGDVHERASALEATIKSRNQILRQLNHALNISFLLTAADDAEEHRLPKEESIRCHAVASWGRLLQKDSLTLTCVLDNSSPYSLDRGWTLCLAVCPLSSSSTATEETSSTNFSFPFHSLGPGETLDVSLPAAAAGQASFPLTVSCSLVFSLSDLLGEGRAASPFGSEIRSLSFPLDTLTVDWLHVLQLTGPTATSHSSGRAADGVRAFLSSRRVGRSRAVDSGGQPERYSASLRVASELLKDTVQLKGLRPDTKGPEPDPQSLGLSLLNWLLSERCGGVKASPGGEKVDSTVVHARAPNGAAVKLTAKEINAQEESVGEEEAVAHVEVQIESSSMAALCGLHHAVLRRTQTLLQMAPVRPASTKGIQMLGLRRVMQQAEIQQSRVSEAFSAGMSSGQTNQFLLSVYRELRQNSLLVI
ncbi:Fanconi anemia core complex-associated protein 100 [Menidia menidia]